MNEVTSTMVRADTAAVVAFVGYLALVVGIGLLTARSSSAGVREFFLGGRKVHRFVVALSAVVSGRSAWLLLGVTGMAYTMGAAAVWAVAGYIVAELLLFLYYARRLRRFAETHDCITLPDFFAARFGDESGALRGVLAGTILIFMVAYVSAQFVGGGKAFQAGFGIDPVSGMMITAAIVLAYTVLGGFLAVSITDVLQACFMIIALVALPTIAWLDFGGFTAVVVELRSLDPTLIQPFPLTLGAGLAAMGFLAIGLGSPGNPHILVRYMSIADERQLRTAAVIGTVWNVVMAWGALFIGLVGRVSYPTVSALPAGDPENIFPVLAQAHLPPIVFGVVVAAIFAAIMSTADSQLLVAASSVVRDLYQGLLRRDRDVPQKVLVLYSRLVVVCLVLAALAFGLLAEQLVFWLVLFAWAGLGAAIGPTSIMALYWKGTTRAGVIAGIVTGTLVTFAWELTPPLSPLLYELIPAFVLSALVTWLVSRATVSRAQSDR